MCLSALHPFKVIHLKNLLFQNKQTKKTTLLKLKVVLRATELSGGLLVAWTGLDWTGFSLHLVCWIKQLKYQYLKYF